MIRFTQNFLNSSFLIFTICNADLVRMVEEQQRTEAVSSSEKETVGYFYLLLLHMTVCIPSICAQCLNKMTKFSLLVCFKCLYIYI